MAMKKAPSVPLMTSNHHQHPVLRDGGAVGGSNIAVRHPATVGPNMMAPRPDHVELPTGTPASSAAGGINGALAPFQTQKGARNGDYRD